MIRFELDVGVIFAQNKVTSARYELRVISPVNIKSEAAFYFAVYLRNLLECIEREGFSSTPFLRRHRLSWEMVRNSEAHVPFQTYVLLVTDVLNSTGIDGLGLKTGNQLNPLDRGLLGYAIYSCENLAKAFGIFCNYVAIAAPCHGHVNVTQNGAYFEFESAFSESWEKVLRYEVEEAFTDWFNISKKWGDTVNWFNEVHFKFARPSYARLYREQFHCPIKFNQSHNRFFFDADYLTRPFAGFSEQLFKLTKAQCVELLKTLPLKGGLAGEIRSILAGCTGQFPSSMQICQHFNCSPATLRRRLANEGTSYKKLLKEFRLQLACRYLEETELSVGEVAHLTGYSDTSNFTRAFKSHYAQLPQQARAIQ